MWIISKNPVTAFGMIERRKFIPHRCLYAQCIDIMVWYKFVIKSNAVGNSFLAVYADDFIAGFQYKEDAERYYKLLKERLNIGLIRNW